MAKSRRHRRHEPVHDQVPSTPIRRWPRKWPTRSPKYFAPTTSSAPHKTLRRRRSAGTQIADYQEKIRHDTESLFNYAREKGLPPTMDRLSTSKGQRLADSEQPGIGARKPTQECAGGLPERENSKDLFSIPEVQKSERISNLQDRISQSEREAKPSRSPTRRNGPRLKRRKLHQPRLEEEIEKEANEAIGSLEGPVRSRARTRKQHPRDVHATARHHRPANARSDRDGRRTRNGSKPTNSI